MSEVPATCPKCHGGRWCRDISRIMVHGPVLVSKWAEGQPKKSFGGESKSRLPKGSRLPPSVVQRVDTWSPMCGPIQRGAHPMFRFTIRDVLWLTALVGVGLAWFSEHRSAQAALRRFERLRQMVVDSERHGHRIVSNEHGGFGFEIKELPSKGITRPETSSPALSDQLTRTTLPAFRFCLSAHHRGDGC